MALPTAQEMAEKWNRNTKNAVQDYRRGIERVTQSPMEKAAQKRDKWEAGIQNAISQGKYEAGLRRVTLQEWRDNAISKGAARLASGADAGTVKMQRFATEILPHIAQGQAALEGMDDTTFEGRVQRAMTFMEHMHTFRRR